MPNSENISFCQKVPIRFLAESPYSRHPHQTKKLSQQSTSLTRFIWFYYYAIQRWRRNCEYQDTTAVLKTRAEDYTWKPSYKPFEIIQNN